MTLPDTLYFDGQAYDKKSSNPAVPLWFHKEDVASGVFLNSEKRPVLRPCATTGGCPAVFIFRTPLLKVVLDMHWQFYLAAINDGMIPADVATELHYHLAFANNTGLGNPNVPRRNYLQGKDLTAQEYPRFDKDRTCARSKLSGVEGYQLGTALSETFQAFRQVRSGERTFANFQRSFRQMLTVNNILKVTILDGNNPPPLKPGKRYPTRLQDVNPSDYLYHPRNPADRHLFFAANTVASIHGGGSRVFPFPRGATYDYMGDGWKYTWFPHVARGPVNYALSKLTKLQPGAPIPTYYRSN